MHEDILAESGNKKTGNSDENPSPWLERCFNRKCYITFLTGCYSCHWQYREWETAELGSCCCSWVQRWKGAGLHFLSCGCGWVPKHRSTHCNFQVRCTKLQFSCQSTVASLEPELNILAAFLFLPASSSPFPFFLLLFYRR